MFKWIGRILAAIGLPGDIQTIGAVVMGSGIIGVLVGWLAWAHENPHWAILIGIGTFAACVWLAIGFHTLTKRFRVFRGLFFDSSQPFGVLIDEGGNLSLPLLVRLRNVTTRELFFNVSRVELELNGRTNKSVGKGETKSSIPPGQIATFRVAAIPGLTYEPELSGSLEFEVEYGTRPDDLRYRLRYTFEPHFRLPGKPDANLPQAPLIYDGANAVSEHQKRKWI